MIDLHISTDEKVTKDTIRRLRDNFIDGNHPYVILGKSYGFDYSEFENIYRIDESISGIIKLLRLMKKANRIHLHGLFSFYLIVLLALDKKLIHKCNWYIMGDDLYCLKRAHNSVRGKIHIAFRKHVLENIGFVSTNVEGDYEIYKSMFPKSKAEFFKLRFSGVAYFQIEKYLMNLTTKPSDTAKRVLLGNSATETNCHFDALKILSKYVGENIEIVVPLSYGNIDYAQRVIEEGRRLFGERFVALNDFMPRDDYYQLLSTIDVAVFAHNRQQAVGNIMPLLYAGRKVFIRSNISTWDCLSNKYGIKIYPYEDINKLSFSDFHQITFDIAEQKSYCLEMTAEKLCMEAYKKALISEAWT